MIGFDGHCFTKCFHTSIRVLMPDTVVCATYTFGNLHSESTLEVELTATDPDLRKSWKLSFFFFFQSNIVKSTERIDKTDSNTGQL